MIQNILSFGKFKGKSFEWLLFNAPWYFHWLKDKQVLTAANGYDVEDRAYFDELYRRADGLFGVCAKCQERHFTRIDISVSPSATASSRWSRGGPSWGR